MKNTRRIMAALGIYDEDHPCECIHGVSCNEFCKKCEEDPAAIRSEKERAEFWKRIKEENERKERLKGYRFWCSEGCGFVDENHRCEQWTNITYVSPQLYEAIKKDKAPK